MTKLGADPEDLRRLATSFERVSEALDDDVRAVGSKVRATGWDGADAQRFLDEWDRTHRPALKEVASALAAATRHLRAQAKDQDDASAHGGAPSGAGTTTPPPPTVQPQPAPPTPPGSYADWRENAARQGVDQRTLDEIAQRFGITADSFTLLEGLQEFTDPDGKSFFLLPDDMSADDARRAAMLTYILNAGTGYGSDPDDDFPATPYSADEVQRIIDRQQDNEWSYSADVGFVHSNGGRLVATPNGMLMGAGGNWLQDLYSQRGGTTYGDIFMLNIDDPGDASTALRDAVQGGKATYEVDGKIVTSNLDLDRVLHHEERHSQQWAREGYGHFLSSYLWEQVTGGNGTEEDAGLHDGGYA